MRNLILACTLLLPGAACLAQPTATPESQGLDSAVLAELVDHLATPSFNTDSILVMRHGRIVSDTYALPFRAELRHDLRSVTKSVVATLVGAALQEGKIASDAQKVMAFFPQHTPTGPAQEAMTLRHLLDMRSGLRWREWPYNAQSDALKMWGSPSFVGFILAREAVAPGEKFQYIAAAPHLLSAILTRATGASAADYARGQLFKALGIGDFQWMADPQGVSVGESGLALTPRDMARIGLLHLRHGQWEGRQLLPPGWAESLFTAQAQRHGMWLSNEPPAYRSLWWADPSVPYAAAGGRHGQHIILLPMQDLMLVVTSKTADSTRGASAAELVRNYLLRAVKADAALPENAAAQARLAQAVQRFANPRGPQSRQPSVAAQAQARRTYVLEPNERGCLEFALQLAAPQPHYRMLRTDRNAATGERADGGPMGLDGRYVESTMRGRPWAHRGRWIDENSFRIDTQDLEGAVMGEWTARFLGEGRLELLYTNGDGDALTLRGRAKD